MAIKLHVFLELLILWRHRKDRVEPQSCRETGCSKLLCTWFHLFTSATYSHAHNLCVLCCECNNSCFEHILHTHSLSLRTYSLSLHTLTLTASTHSWPPHTLSQPTHSFDKLKLQPLILIFIIYLDKPGDRWGRGHIDRMCLVSSCHIPFSSASWPLHRLPQLVKPTRADSRETIKHQIDTRVVHEDCGSHAQTSLALLFSLSSSFCKDVTSEVFSSSCSWICRTSPLRNRSLLCDPCSCLGLLARSTATEDMAQNSNNGPSHIWKIPETSSVFTTGNDVEGSLKLLVPVLTSREKWEIPKF